MATLFQAPMYVPTFYDSESWSPAIDNTAANTIDLLAQQKVFGQGGQVPTPRFASQYMQDTADSALWSWATPPDRSGVLGATQTQVKFFAGPGQQAQKLWPPAYTQDDASYHYSQPRSSRGLIQLAAAEQVWFGAPGQVPTKFWAPYFDDSSVWLGLWRSNWISAFLANAPLEPKTQPPVTLRLFDDSSGWFSPNYQPQANLLNLIQSMFTGQERRPGSTPFLGDDPASWQRTRRGTVINIATVISGLIPAYYTSGFDDTWGPHPFPAPQALSQSMLVSGGYPAAELWQWDYDEGGLWQGSPRLQQSLSVQLTSVAPFFKQWLWLTDDSSFWEGEPEIAQPLSSLMAKLPTSPTKLWVPYQDDSSGWNGLGGPLRAFAIHEVFVGGQPAAALWRPDYDDIIGWLAAPQSSDIISMLTGALPAFGEPFHKLWTPYSDDSSTWLAAPRATLYWTNPGAFQPASFPQWLTPRTLDDPPTWAPAAETLNSWLVQALAHTPTSHAKLWVPYQDDPAEWRGGPISTKFTNLQIPSPTVPIRWPVEQFGDDSSLWNIGPQQAFALAQALAQPSPKTYPWTLARLAAIDDPPVWLAKPLISQNIATLFTFTGQTNKNWGQLVSLLDDPSVYQWLAPPQSIANQLAVTPTINTFAPLWPQSFGDDAAYWVGNPKISGVLKQLNQGGLLGGGQVIPPDWLRGYTYDDSSTWAWTWFLQNYQIAQVVPLNAWHSGAYMAHLQQLIGDDPQMWLGRPSSGFTVNVPQPPVVQQIFEWLIRMRRRRGR